MSRHDDVRRILDRIFPDEADMLPSAREWARTLPSGALELRDPNDGACGEAADRTRHQYLVARGHLWRRRLPPAPLAVRHDDEEQDRWRDDPAASRWALADDVSGVVAEWAVAMGWDRLAAARARRAAVPAGSYLMPPADPHDCWADITGVPCPVPGCGQTLVWYEAGYVPGYRVCMAPAAGGDGYAIDTMRHRFTCPPARAGGWQVAVLEARTGGEA